MYIHDTIAAICTPIGEGGIGVIRISGDKAREIGSRIFSYKTDGGFESHRFYYGSIIEPADCSVLDEAMVVYMQSPRSYTFEDVLEIHCHGGPLVMKRVLGLVLRHGARMADPGEFTRRAFLNGRIDLVQAEAVIDIIRGKTDSALSLAQHQREGLLSRQMSDIRELIIRALTLVEAHIDFPEDEIGSDASAEIRGAVAEAAARVNGLLDGFEEGRSLREGVSVLIAGKPNVGKSSLLNTLLKQKRAIVTDQPGTTRDFIEEVVNIGGLPVRLLDTAGICETENAIEKEGVQLALNRISSADLILFMLDVSRPFDSDDVRIEKELDGKKAIVILNKCDLADEIVLPDSIRTKSIIRLSTRTGEGVDDLLLAVRDQFLHGKAVDSREYAAISNVRHRDALEKCAMALMQFAENEANGSVQEIGAVDLRDALHAIGDITGETTPDEVLDRIFQRFCVGK